MLTMINKMKFFSWLKLWHHSKNSSSGNAGENNQNTHHRNHGEQPVRNAMMKYGKRDWMRNWNLLHLDKRSCAQTKDVYTADQHQQPSQQGTCRSQLASASDHLAPSTGAMVDHVAHISIRSSSLDLDEKEIESHNVVFLLGHKQHQEGVVDTETLKANAVGEAAKRETTALDITVVTSGLDIQQHKSGLKNKVLPLTTQEIAVIGTNTSSTTANMTCSADVSAANDYIRSSENGPLSLKRIVTRPDTMRGTGAPCLKKIHSAKVSSPESPKTPRDIKWRKLLSYSRSSSPRSPSCFNQGDWSSQKLAERGSVHHQKGSYSTMGSPWNSQAGGNRSHNHRRASFKSTYNHGQWITTDSDFVVLEL